MADHLQDTGEDARRWVTGGGGEGDPALPLPDIVSEMETEIATFANLIPDETGLPSDVRIRPRTFRDPSEISDYLADAGLLWKSDTSPTGYIVSDFAYIIPYIDPENEDHIEWDLYISDGSP